MKVALNTRNRLELTEHNLPQLLIALAILSLGVVLTLLEAGVFGLILIASGLLLCLNPGTFRVSFDRAARQVLIKHDAWLSPFRIDQTADLTHATGVNVETSHRTNALVLVMDSGDPVFLGPVYGILPGRNTAEATVRAWLAHKR
ncbi:MAG: hypothetical protein JKY00_07705 [Roseicyclus sp.]|nr:hypothetical protein [Roseicyclus sp.]